MPKNFAAGNDATPNDIAALLLLGLLWGGSFSLIKIAIDTIPPILVAFGRVAVAAGFLTSVVSFLRLRLPRDRKTWMTLVVLGFTGNALPFYLISSGEQYVSSASAAIMMALVPLITLTSAIVVGIEGRISNIRLAAVVLGFLAIAALFGNAVVAGKASLIGYAFLLVSAVSYSWSILLARSLRKIPPFVCAAGAMLTALLWLLPAAVVTYLHVPLSADSASIWSVVLLGLLSTGLAAVLFFRLTFRVGPTFASLNSYLVPVFGVIFGAALLREPVPELAYLALGIVLLAIYLSRREERSPTSPGASTDPAKQPQA